MNPRLLIIVFFIITSQTISAQELGEPTSTSEVQSSPSPIQSQDFTLTDPRAFKEDTLGDERLTDENKPLVFNISGKAKVVDGDTITINNTKIRFSGIDAPESYYYGQTQYCKKLN
jgi:endonuclease YncB( thermonuclease family)